MTVAEFATIGAVVVSALGAIFGLIQARKADKSASTTETIRIGVKDLVDQYQEANAELRQQAHDCAAQVKAIEVDMVALREEVRELKEQNEALINISDDKDAEIIRLKHALGDFKP